MFRAVPLEGGEPVALQRLDSPLAPAKKELLERLKATTSSPHLCQFLTIGTTPEAHWYIVYPLIEGGDLETRRADFEQGRVPLRTALRWSIDALKGLEALHQAGFLHGDIKPSNLMLDGDKVVVCDFSTLTPLSGPWKARSDAGTPEYLPSDEGLLRSPLRDLHALGLTMTGLLTGTLVKDIEEAVPSRYDPLLPAALDEVVAKAVGLSPRFASAQEMRQTLEALLTGPVPVASSLSPPTRRVEWKAAVHKPPLWPWLAALAMLFLGAWARALQPETAAPSRAATALWSGVGVRPAAVENRLIWQVVIAGRPVAAFAGSDPAAGQESARDRALWCAAVLEEAHFQKRKLEFVSKRALPDSCDVYLKIPEQPDKFVFRVSPAESMLFERQAPLVAEVWTSLISQTSNLVRPGASPERKGPSGLILTPWQRRYETLRGQRGTLDQPSRVNLLREALESLPTEPRDNIWHAYRDLPEEPK